MKKFLVFFVMLFGLACSAMAESFPRDMQNDDIEDCYEEWPSDGAVEYAIYFDTDYVTTQSQCSSNYQQIKSELTNLVNDIGSIEIIGSADCQGGTTAHNVDLSKNRAQWAIDNIIPNSFKQYCDGRTHTDRCKVWAMGESNDAAYDPSRYTGQGCKRNSNQSARAVYVNVIWRSQTCKDMAADKVQNIKKSLQDENIDWIKAEQLKVKEQLKDIILRAEKKIAKLEEICNGSNNGKRLTPTEVGNYNDLFGDLGTILTELLKLNAELPEPVIVGGGQLEVYVDTYFNLTIDIDKIYARLLKLRESLDVSVWRNAEGKFNTARLASDSIAGVVLGTVGGIVTSKLVKKNQLKKGFEDLSCHVGGQRVADYGDSFRMGLEN